MKQIDKVSESENHTAINIGRMDEIQNYSMVHPKNGQTITGKIFIKEALKATGTEISFNSIPPRTEVPYSIAT